jgi:hypothetical protein
LPTFLVACGVPPEAMHVQAAVALTDDVTPKLHEPAPRVDLHEKHGDEVIEVGYNPVSGWTADLGLDEPGARGRMDLRQAALGDSAARPEVPADALSARTLAAFLAGHLGYRALPAGTRPLRRYAPTPRSTTLKGCAGAASGMHAPRRQRTRGKSVANTSSD